MSALTIARPRLQLPGVVATGWSHFLDRLGADLDPSLDPWLMHPFGLLGAAALPDHDGPVVYAAMNLVDECRYVGQSVDVVKRFRGHGKDRGKRQRWNYVLVAGVAESAAHATLGNAETTARLLLRPREGTRTPRVR